MILGSVYRKLAAVMAVLSRFIEQSSSKRHDRASWRAGHADDR